MAWLVVLECPVAWPRHVAQTLADRLEADELPHEVNVLLVEENRAHIVNLDDDGWTVEHPLGCRAAPGLQNCFLTRWMHANTDRHRGMTGRYVATLNGQDVELVSVDARGAN